MNELLPFKKLEEGIVSVCCMCFPGSSIVDLFPELKGSRLSHGYCQNHLKEMMATLKAAPKKI
jgi:hypothetical protein